MNQYGNHRLAHLGISNVCGVYLLRDTVTGATYVGSSSRVRARIGQHFADMLRRPQAATYLRMAQTFLTHGAQAFVVTVLEVCAPSCLNSRERFWIGELQPSENSYLCVDGRRVYSASTRERKSAAAAALWATPEYRQRAVAVRLGKATNKGYRCTEEQRKNRQRAARISNMKRNYGTEWVQEYRRRYPEHAGDVNG
jgi:group I intron endonuclease